MIFSGCSQSIHGKAAESFFLTDLIRCCKFPRPRPSRKLKVFSYFASSPLEIELACGVYFLLVFPFRFLFVHLPSAYSVDQFFLPKLPARSQTNKFCHASFLLQGLFFLSRWRMRILVWRVEPRWVTCRRTISPGRRWRGSTTWPASTLPNIRTSRWRARAWRSPGPSPTSRRPACTSWCWRPYATWATPPRRLFKSTASPPSSIAATSWVARRPDQGQLIYRIRLWLIDWLAKKEVIILQRLLIMFPSFFSLASHPIFWFRFFHFLLMVSDLSFLMHFDCLGLWERCALTDWSMVQWFDWLIDWLIDWWSMRSSF